MSHLWQGFAPFFFFFFGRLSVTSCLPFLFLCSSVASRVSLPVQFVWILLSYSHCSGTQKLIGLSDTVHIVQLSFVPVQYFPINFSVKVPRWGSLVNRAWKSISLGQVNPPPPHAHTHTPPLVPIAWLSG